MSGHNSLQQLLAALSTDPPKDPGASGTFVLDRAIMVFNCTTAAAESRTLPTPIVSGQDVTVCLMTDGGDLTLTVTGGYDPAGSTTLVLDDAGDMVRFQAVKSATSTLVWRIVAQQGAVDTSLSLGPARLLWENADANANELLVQLPAGGSVNVPVVVLGQSIAGVDLGIHNGLVNPHLSLMASGAVTSASVIEFRKARGTLAAPTVVTTGDDLGTINFYGCVAAGEYVLGAAIRADMAGTIATTRGPSTLTFLTATDAAPSVLTAAMTISAAQLVTCAAGLTVTTGAVTVSSGNVVLTSGHVSFTAASDVIIPANTAAALEITDGTTALHAIDSRNTVTVQNHILTGPASQTLPNGATSRARIVSIPSRTITLLGTTQVTTENLGVQMFIDAVTIAQSGGAVTVDRVSGLHVGTPVAGSSVTITANHIISTGTAGCFCTAAGAWTDTSGESHKTDFANADPKDILSILDRTDIKRFRYKNPSDGNVLRIGGVAEYVPEELVQPGRFGIAARDVAWLGVASAKVLREQVAALESRLALLEAA